MSGTTISLDVIVVGAGIAGLAAAHALKLAGHNVKIFEKSLQKGEVGAGINITANATKILQSWGFDFASARALECRGYQLFHAENLKLREQVSVGNSFGADFHFLFRPDYHRELRRLVEASAKGAKSDSIRLGNEVTHIDTSAGFLVLEDGSFERADLIIGADGVHSTCRKYVTTDIEPMRTGWNAFRFTVPTEKMLQLPNAVELYLKKRGWWSVLTSEHQGLIWYECKGGELQNFVAYFKFDGNITKDATQRELLVELLEEFAGFHPVVISILRLAEDIKPWNLLYQHPLSSWSQGPLLLVGDAAHPVHSVQSGQGSNLAIEDAGALQILFQNITSKDDIPERIAKFEHIRCKRAGAVQTLSRISRGSESQAAAELNPLLPNNVEVFDGASRDAFIYGHDTIAECMSMMKGQG